MKRYVWGMLIGIVGGWVGGGSGVLAAEAPASSQVVAEAAKVVSTGPAQVFNQIELRVGNEMITTLDIEEPLRQLRERLKQDFRGAELEAKMNEARQKHLESLIEARLLLLEARDQKIEIPDNVVEERTTQEIAALREQFESTSAFEKQLAAEHLTLETLRQQRQALVRENLLRQRLLQQKFQEFKTGVDFSDTQLREYYDQHLDEFKNPPRAKIRQIFVAHPDAGLSADAFKRLDDQALGRMQKSLAELKQGKSFEAVAREYSEHRASAERGGEIGWIEKGDTGLPELEKAIFSGLKTNERSGILDTARGYFIVQLQDRQSGGQIPFDEVRGRISQKLMAQGSEQRYRAWIGQLKEKFPIHQADK